MAEMRPARAEGLESARPTSTVIGVVGGSGPTVTTSDAGEYAGATTTSVPAGVEGARNPTFGDAIVALAGDCPGPAKTGRPSGGTDPTRTTATTAARMSPRASALYAILLPDPSRRNPKLLTDASVRKNS